MNRGLNQICYRNFKTEETGELMNSDRIDRWNSMALLDHLKRRDTTDQHILLKRQGSEFDTYTGFWIRWHECCHDAPLLPGYIEKRKWCNGGVYEEPAVACRTTPLLNHLWCNRASSVERLTSENAGKRYSVNNKRGGEWAVEWTVPGTPVANIWIDTISAASIGRFYRIRLSMIAIGISPQFEHRHRNQTFLALLVE